MKLTSPAFENNQFIAPRHTSDGEDLSPPLRWKDVPEKCKSLAIVVEDMDATSIPGREVPFVHWLIYNIPPDTLSLPGGIFPRELPAFPAGAAQGKNSFGKIGYAGPMPPVGSPPHHYVFSLYAFGRETELDPGLSKRELIDKMRGGILEISRLTCLYERVAAKAG